MLEFDHCDGAKKKCHPSNLPDVLYSMESIAKELALTAIRCSACHKRHSHGGTPLAESECMGEETVRMALEEWRKR